MSKIFLRTLSILVLCAGLAAFAFAPARAQEMTCPEHTPVVLDIKPGSAENKINLAARGLLPVAVLSTADFTASLFTPEMAHLSDAATAMAEGCSGATAARWVRSDVNADGRLDLVFFFRVQELNLTPSSTAATLMAHGMYGDTTLHIMGSDSVQVILK